MRRDCDRRVEPVCHGDCFVGLFLGGNLDKYRAIGQFFCDFDVANSTLYKLLDSKDVVLYWEAIQCLDYKESGEV